MSVRDANKAQPQTPIIPLAKQSVDTDDSSTAANNSAQQLPEPVMRSGRTRVPANPRAKVQPVNAASSTASTSSLPSSSFSSTSLPRTEPQVTAPSSAAKPAPATKAAFEIHPGVTVLGGIEWGPMAGISMQFNLKLVSVNVEKRLKAQGIAITSEDVNKSEAAATLLNKMGAGSSSSGVMQYLGDQMLSRQNIEAFKAAQTEAYLAEGKQSLDALGSATRINKKIEPYVWLVPMTLQATGENLVKFFDLALGFRETGIDLPSMIVNEAIEKGNVDFLRRLRTAYPAMSFAKLLSSALTEASKVQFLPDAGKRREIVSMALADGGVPDSMRERVKLEDLALLANDAELIALLLKGGISTKPYADPNAVPLLHRAARTSNLAVFKLLVEAGLDINQRQWSKEGDHVMAIAASRKDNLPMLKYLVEECPGIENRRKKVEGARNVAEFHKHEELAGYLNKALETAKD